MRAWLTAYFLKKKDDGPYVSNSENLKDQVVVVAAAKVLALACNIRKKRIILGDINLEEWSSIVALKNNLLIQLTLETCRFLGLYVYVIK